MWTKVMAEIGTQSVTEIGTEVRAEAMSEAVFGRAAAPQLEAEDRGKGLRQQAYFELERQAGESFIRLAAVRRSVLKGAASAGHSLSVRGTAPRGRAYALTRLVLAGTIWE